MNASAQNSNVSGSNWLPSSIAAGVTVALLTALTLSVRSNCVAAGERLTTPDVAKPKVATAEDAEAKYCTPQFKDVLQRVLHSCGLMNENSRRGCKPADVKTFASISDEDFNALFRPLKDRGGVVLFETGKDDLDEAARKLIDERWEDRRGARYFLVVGRASTTGSTEKNRALSHRRANSVLFRVKELTPDDPDIENKVGLLWLGSEFAQLDEKEFCAWPNSGAPTDQAGAQGDKVAAKGAEKCDDKAINQSAFASWVDCRL
ncbi:MAG TPA: OmpA family protein [Polyangiaceae bacterium]|nr:OmpA family protein [Polyangiaceae bacterium]